LLIIPACETISAQAVYGSSELANIALATRNGFGVPLTGVADVIASGEMGQIAHHASSMEINRSPEFNHTDMDVPGILPTAGLTRIARGCAKIIDQVNNLDMKQLQRGPPAGMQGNQ
jgi:hypothetical protein